MKTQHVQATYHRVPAAAPLLKDAARVKTVREAIGDGIQLMMDADHLVDPMQAAELCRLVEPLEITWYEEPLHGNDARKLAELRSKTRIPISAGQNEGHRWRHQELIVNNAVDIVQPNVPFVGGYTKALKVAHLAQIFNLEGSQKAQRGIPEYATRPCPSAGCKLSSVLGFLDRPPPTTARAGELRPYPRSDVAAPQPSASRPVCSRYPSRYPDRLGDPC